MRHHPGHLIPEGKFKELVKKVYRKVFPHNFTEITLENGMYQYLFKNGINIKFHRREFIDISSPLRGYLKKYHPKKGDVVIDLGAFKGMFSVYSSKAVGNEGKVFSFEPNPTNYKDLLDNIKLNNAKNIHPLQGGLWNKRTKIRLSDDESLSSIVYQKDKGKSFEVNVETLDEFVKRMKLKKVSFIKMDVEGAEFEILDGATETLRKFHPHLAIASYHWRDGEQTYKKVEKKLRQFGYKPTTGFPSHLTTYG